MMQEQMQTKLDDYVAVFELAKARTGSEEIAAMIVEQLGKDSRTAMLSNGRRANTTAPFEVPAQANQGPTPRTKRRIEAGFARGQGQ